MLHIPKKALLMAARLRPQEVFATSLYTGNGSTQTITNGLDLAGKGGLVWTKARSVSTAHGLFDTIRGPGKLLFSNATNAEATDNASLTSFTGSGFTSGSDGSNGVINQSGATYAAWSFRRAAKFFDIVTYTGNGVAGRQIPHGLGVVPGMIVVKARNTTSDWNVWHRNMPTPSYRLQLNATDAQNNLGHGQPDAAVFRPAPADNQSGITYIAYLFAQNPDLIDCGSYTGNGSATGPVVTCGSGWRPQFVMIKSATGTGSWYMFDSARGIQNGGPNEPRLLANSSVEETTLASGFIDTSPTGFSLTTSQAEVNSSNSFVYLAIREPT